MDILTSTVILIILAAALLRAPFLFRDYILYEDRLTLWFAQKAQYYAALLGEEVNRNGSAFTIDDQQYILHVSCIDFGMMMFISLTILALFTALRRWRLTSTAYIFWEIAIFATTVFMNTVRMGVQLYLLANNPDLLSVGYANFELTLVVSYILFLAFFWGIIGIALNITD